MRTGISIEVSRFMQEGVAGLLRDKTRPSRIPPLGSAIVLSVGVFSSIIDLQAAINRFLAETNHAQKPFTWTADPDKIIAAVRRGPLGGRQSLTFASNVVLPSAHSVRLFGHRSAFQAIRACLWCFMIGAVAVWARKNRGAVQCEIVRDHTSCGPALEFASGWIGGLLSYPRS
jgi:hypothetical protein